MKVLVDTCIWSHALGSKKPEFEAEVKILEALISEDRVLIIGPIRQELLSGYIDLAKFEILCSKLSYFQNTAIMDDDYRFICNRDFVLTESYPPAIKPAELPV